MRASAGKMETSLLWALEPACVDVSRLPGRGDPGPHFAMGPSAFESDLRAGERMADDEACWLGEKGRALLAAHAAEPPAQRFSTFAQVEALWADVIAPRLPQFETMQTWEGDEPPAADSVWRASWPIPSVGSRGEII